MTLEKIIFGKPGSDMAWRLAFFSLLFFSFWLTFIFLVWSLKAMMLGEPLVCGVNAICEFYHGSITHWLEGYLMGTINLQVGIYGGVFLLSFLTYIVLWFRKRQRQA